MRSKTSNKILSETPHEVREKVRLHYSNNYAVCNQILTEKLKDIRRLRSDETYHLVIEAMQEYAHGEVRDFKLLVREYFQAKSQYDHVYESRWIIDNILFKNMDNLEKRILSELERFTLEDVEELPFKTTEE
jgi:hypothetical protein